MAKKKKQAVQADLEDQKPVLADPQDGDAWVDEGPVAGPSEPNSNLRKSPRLNPTPKKGKTKGKGKAKSQPNPPKPKKSKSTNAMSAYARLLSERETRVATLEAENEELKQSLQNAQEKPTPTQKQLENTINQIRAQNKTFRKDRDTSRADAVQMENKFHALQDETKHKDRKWQEELDAKRAQRDKLATDNVQLREELRKKDLLLQQANEHARNAHKQALRVDDLSDELKVAEAKITERDQRISTLKTMFAELQQISVSASKALESSDRPPQANTSSVHHSTSPQAQQPQPVAGPSRLPPPLADVKPSIHPPSNPQSLPQPPPKPIPVHPPQLAGRAPIPIVTPTAQWQGRTQAQSSTSNAAPQRSFDPPRGPVATSQAQPQQGTKRRWPENDEPPRPPPPLRPQAMGSQDSGWPRRN